MWADTQGKALSLFLEHQMTTKFMFAIVSIVNIGNLFHVHTEAWKGNFPMKESYWVWPHNLLNPTHSQNDFIGNFL